MLQGISRSSTKWMGMPLYSVLDPPPATHLIPYSVQSIVYLWSPLTSFECTTRCACVWCARVCACVRACVCVCVHVHVSQTVSDVVYFMTSHCRRLSGVEVTTAHPVHVQDCACMTVTRLYPLSDDSHKTVPLVR